ncbi:hypothetical protein DFH11DRAFT_1875083, partial [Phellopilus nigrolimitatus]
MYSDTFVPGNVQDTLRSKWHSGMPSMAFEGDHLRISANIHESSSSFSLPLTGKAYDTESTNAFLAGNTRAIKLEDLEPHLPWSADLSEVEATASMSSLPPLSSGLSSPTLSELPLTPRDEFTCLPTPWSTTPLTSFTPGMPGFLCSGAVGGPSAFEEFVQHNNLGMGDSIYAPGVGIPDLSIPHKSTSEVVLRKEHIAKQEEMDLGAHLVLAGEQGRLSQMLQSLQAPTTLLGMDHLDHDLSPPTQPMFTVVPSIANDSLRSSHFHLASPPTFLSTDVVNYNVDSSMGNARMSSMTNDVHMSFPTHVGYRGTPASLSVSALSTQLQSSEIPLGTYTPTSVSYNENISQRVSGENPFFTKQPPMLFGATNFVDLTGNGGTFSKTAGDMFAGNTRNVEDCMHTSDGSLYISKTTDDLCTHRDFKLGNIVYAPEGSATDTSSICQTHSHGVDQSSRSPFFSTRIEAKSADHCRTALHTSINYPTINGQTQSEADSLTVKLEITEPEIPNAFLTLKTHTSPTSSTPPSSDKMPSIKCEELLSKSLPACILPPAKKPRKKYVNYTKSFRLFSEREAAMDPPLDVEELLARDENLKICNGGIKNAGDGYFTCVLCGPI